MLSPAADPAPEDLWIISVVVASHPGPALCSLSLRIGSAPCSYDYEDILGLTTVTDKMKTFNCNLDDSLYQHLIPWDERPNSFLFFWSFVSSSAIPLSQDRRHSEVDLPWTNQNRVEDAGPDRIGILLQWWCWKCCHHRQGVSASCLNLDWQRACCYAYQALSNLS